MGVFETFVNKCGSIETLEIEDMDLISKDIRLGLFSKLKDLISYSEGLKTLKMSRFSSDKADEEEGQAVLEALASSDLCKLTELSIDFNHSWFGRDGRIDLLCTLLSR